MVTVREARRQQEERERLQRIEAARREGARIGKENAKRYATMKNHQRQAVEDDMKGMWAASMAHKRDTLDQRLVQVTEHYGGAMKTAAAQQGERIAAAHDEAAAWEAEHRLEALRAHNAAQHLRLEKAEGASASTERLARKRMVRAAEDQRARSAVERRRQAKADASASGLSTSIGAQLDESEIGPRRLAPRPQANVVVVQNAAQRAAEQAEKHRLEKEAMRQKTVQRTEEQQIATMQRASSIMAAKRRQEEERELERQRQEELKKTLHEAARSSRHPINARDFQAEESRRSEATLRKATKEFENVFLQPSSWPIMELEELEAAVERARRNDAAILGLDDELEQPPINPDEVF